MSAWVVFGLATLPFLTMRVLQVRFHDDIDGSSLARAIYASTGPLLLPFDSGFLTHTHIAEGIEISALFVSSYCKAAAGSCRINALAQHGQAQCVA